jgi:predicted protein tyrosine phosphatase
MSDYREQLLFVCSRNQWRSPTAEALFQHSNRYVARSAGTSDRARTKITAGLINWADWIFVMEKRHAAIIRQKYPDAIGGKSLAQPLGKSIVVLHIEDNYQYMDSELIDILESRLSEYLEID